MSEKISNLLKWPMKKEAFIEACKNKTPEEQILFLFEIFQKVRRGIAEVLRVTEEMKLKNYFILVETMRLLHEKYANVYGFSFDFDNSYNEAKRIIDERWEDIKTLANRKKIKDEFDEMTGNNGQEV